MNNAKKVMYTVGVGFLAGAVIGMLYAPDKGSETRAKLRRLKERFTCCSNDELDEYDKETLEEISASLREQLNKIDERLGKG